MENYNNYNNIIIIIIMSMESINLHFDDNFSCKVSRSNVKVNGQSLKLKQFEGSP